MFKIFKKFLVCWWYEKDIWGYIIAKHKNANLARTKVRPNIENVPHLAKKKRLLQDFSKWLSSSGFWVLNFSFEIIRRMKKRKPWKMKNWMWFFFLTKILWIFYGNLKKQTFTNYCNICVSKKSQAIFLFLKFFECRLPMFLYWIGFAPSVNGAEEWITKGYVFINNKRVYSIYKIIKLYDFLTFDPILWWKIIWNLTRIFYYGSKATKWRRCVPTKLWSLEKISRAHFISIPNHIYADFRSFSLYWWKEAVPTTLRYYFSVNVANILKYVTI